MDLEATVLAIKNGDIATLSRAITMVESKKEEHQQWASQLVETLLPYTGKAKRLGITGVPGVGKSTFIESFGMFLINKGLKVAVLAIDPSSTLSKGSILGDKTRMEQLSVHANAFIRPSASMGSLGGLTYKTRESLLLCEAAGFDVVLVETVGVGQSETAVADITDFFLLLMLSGAGDELQGIKRGIMEMADGMVITKADGDNLPKAKMARSEYARALHFFPPHSSGWYPQVKIASSYNNSGIEEVWEMIEQYYQHTTINGFLNEKRILQNTQTFNRLIEERLKAHFLERSGISQLLKQLETEVATGASNPYIAVNKLFEHIV